HYIATQKNILTNRHPETILGTKKRKGSMKNGLRKRLQKDGTADDKRLQGRIRQRHQCNEHDSGKHRESGQVVPGSVHLASRRGQETRQFLDDGIQEGL